MHDREFLIWFLARMIRLDEEANLTTDYVTKMASIIDRTHKEQCSANIASPERVEELLRGKV